MLVLEYRYDTLVLGFANPGMCMIRRLFLFLIGISAAFSAEADYLDLNLNDDAAMLSYGHDLSGRKLRIEGSWLHHQDRGDIAGIGLQLVDFASGGSNPLTAGIGIKAFFINPDFDLDGGALGLGGSVEYTLPQSNRIGLEGHLYFAPDVVAFGDVSQYLEVSARVRYNILRDADLYIGLRNNNVEFDGGGSFSIDTGFHVGIKIRF